MVTCLPTYTHLHMPSYLPTYTHIDLPAYLYQHAMFSLLAAHETVCNKVVIFKSIFIPSVSH
jgi:hypothetical protein